MSEVWTAQEYREVDGNDSIVFDVLDEDTGEHREEIRYKAGLPLMFVTGGYPPQMGALMIMQPLPWRFRKNRGHIYLDGPSVGVPDYHPIDKEG
jgi:hypothetical protein